MNFNVSMICSNKALHSGILWPYFQYNERLTIERWYANADDISVFLNAANPKHWPLEEMKAVGSAPA